MNKNKTENYTMSLKEQDMYRLGERFVTHLHNTEINLVENGDGRLESLDSELSITESLRENFKDVPFLDKDNNRAFGDIDVEIVDRDFPPTDIQTIFPINVKMIDEKTGSYNGGGVKLFNYVLFGGGDTNFPVVAKKIRDNRPTKIQREYFYLVYYKRSNKKPQFVSLTDIDRDSIIINPSNPLQIKQDLKTVERTESEKVDFMIELFYEICEKKAKAYMILKGKI